MHILFTLKNNNMKSAKNKNTDRLTIMATLLEIPR